MTRIVAALAAVALLAAGGYGLLIAVLWAVMVAQRPDPAVPDGDPCCGHPDTWGQVAVGAGWTLLLVALCCMAVAGAVALVARAAGRRRLPVRPFAWGTAGVVALTAATMGLLVVA